MAPSPLRKRISNHTRESYPRISDAHATALGHVAANWALAEDWLTFLIGHVLLKLHTDVGLAVSAELSALQRVALVGTLIHRAGNQEWIDNWQDVYRAFDGLRARRNDAVHAVWDVKESRHLARRVKAKGKLVVHLNIVEPEDLGQLADEIAELVGMIDDFAFSVFGEADAILKSPPEPAPHPAPGRKARAQAEAGARKKARREADRAASRKPGDTDAS